MLSSLARPDPMSGFLCLCVCCPPPLSCRPVITVAVSDLKCRFLSVFADLPPGGGFFFLIFPFSSQFPRSSNRACTPAQRAPHSHSLLSTSPVCSPVACSFSLAHLLFLESCLQPECRLCLWRGTPISDSRIILKSHCVRSLSFPQRQVSHILCKNCTNHMKNSFCPPM